MVPKAFKAYKGYWVHKELWVVKAFKALMEHKEFRAYKGYWAHKAFKAYRAR